MLFGSFLVVVVIVELILVGVLVVEGFLRGGWISNVGVGV